MLEQVVERMQKELQSKAFDGSLKFDCGDEGVVVLADGTASQQDRDADCTIKITQDNLIKLLTGKLNPMTGVMTGKLKVSGDMSVAMKLGKLLG
ncbi:SCP-2 sterol transfer family protein [Shimia sp. SK013]|uniref:SCP2 sterol-binding domain-containing protein n=1 Tax=Shimia sp. SK013 TaxID=1389006 RepID=UPI0006B60B71|nr:SCP2 sterol-binding domain-containing protein [Shimia sp. SK013]KPA19782.1 SCP-2 sterol transfer family protein [Shimia sp. SK013]